MEVCGAARGVTHLPQAVLQAWCVAAPHTPGGNLTSRILTRSIIPMTPGQML